MPTTVYKTIGANEYEAFDRKLNKLIQLGWSKAETTVFDAEGMHTTLSASAEILPSFMSDSGLDDAANNAFQANFADLSKTFHLPQTAKAARVPSGSLIHWAIQSQYGRFKWADMEFDLVHWEDERGDRVLGYVRVANGGATPFSGPLARSYQL